MTTATSTPAVVRTRLREAYALRYSNLTEAIKIVRAVLDDVVGNENEQETGVAQNLLGYLEILHGNFLDAMQHLHAAEQILIKYPEETGEISCIHYNKGLLNMRLGNFREAHTLFEISLQQNAANHLPERTAQSLFQLGVASKEVEDYEQARRWLNECLEINQAHQFRSGEAAALMQLGDVEMLCGNLEDAEKLLKKSVLVRDHQLDPRGYSANMQSLGRFYLTKNDPVSAEIYFRQGLEITQKQNDVFGHTILMHGLGDTQLKNGRPISALDTLKHALEIAQKHAQQNLHLLHRSISDVYSAQGRFEEALEHYKIYSQLREKNINSELVNKFRFTQLEQEARNAHREAEINLQRSVEIQTAMAEIERKNKSILDSIDYASRIQKAILPSNEELINTAGNAFVFYQPRDMVSGDFWWVHRKNNILHAAVADCTGHGVPGALLSILGLNELNELMSRNICDPAEMLEHMREFFTRTLNQRDQSSVHLDGMDIGVFKFNLSSRKLIFSGANIPLIMVNNGVISEIKGDKQPVGFSHYATPFTSNEVEIAENTMLYLASDGYADQFGGENKRKFKSKSLRQLLLDIHALPITQQKEKIANTFYSWKNNEEQTDDVCVMGIQL